MREKVNEEPACHSRLETRWTGICFHLPSIRVFYRTIRLLIWEGLISLPLTVI